MSSPNFDTEGPLLQDTNTRDPEMSSGAGGAESSSAFFDEISGFFSKRAQRRSMRRLKEERQDVAKESREAGAEVGTERAEDQKPLDLEEDDTVSQRQFNNAQKEAYLSETSLNVRKKAQELTRKYNRDPDKWEREFNEFIGGVEEELPSTVVPDFRRTVETTKRQHLNRVNQNFIEHNRQEAKASIEESLRQHSMDIGSTANMAGQGIGNMSKDDIRNQVNDFKNGLNRKVENDVIGPVQKKNMLRSLKTKVATEYVVGQYVKSDNPNQLYNNLRKDRDEDLKENRVDTGIENITDRQRTKILRRLDSIRSASGALGGTDLNIDDGLGESIERTLRRGEQPNREAMTEYRRQLDANAGSDAAENARLDLKEAQAVQPEARDSLVFTEEKQFDDLIERGQQMKSNLNKQELSPEEFRDRESELNAKIEFLKNKRNNFESDIENPIQFAKNNLTRYANIASDSEMKALADQYDMSPQELRNRMTVEDLQIDFAMDEEGNVVGLTEESLEGVKERIRDASFASEVTNQKMSFFGDVERDMFVRDLNNLDAEQKIQLMRPFLEGFQTASNKDSIAVFRAAQEISADDKGSGDDSFAQSLAIASTNPSAAERNLKGAELRRKLGGGEKGPEGFKLPGDNLEGRISAMLGKHFNPEAIPADKMRRVKNATLNILTAKMAGGDLKREAVMFDTAGSYLGLSDGEGEPIEPDDIDIPDPVLKQTVSEALGGKQKSGGGVVGGLGTIGNNDVVLPTSLTEEQANSWWNLIGNTKETPHTLGRPETDEFIEKERNVTLKELSNKFGFDTRELSISTGYSVNEELSTDDIIGLMEDMKVEAGATLPMFEDDKTSFSEDDASKVIREVKPEYEDVESIFGEGASPMKYLSQTGLPPQSDGERWTREDIVEENRAGNIDLVPTAKDGVYFIRVRDSFYLEQPGGGNYRLNMNKLQGSPRR